MRSVLLLLAALWAVPLHATDTTSSASDSLPRSPVPVQVPPPPWQNGLRSLVLPGWGQFTVGHPIRGTVAGIMDVWLYADVAQRTWTSIPKLRRTTRDLDLQVASQRTFVDKDAAAVASDTTNMDAKANLVSSKALLRSLQDSASKARGRARTSADYRNCEAAWAAGVHLYAVADAAEDAWLQRGGRRPVTDMATAAIASAVVPGLGQIYNTHYSKAALLYCGVIGAVVSYQSHQSMVEFWQGENTRALSDSTSTTEIQQQLVFFRKRRNQYVWGLGLIYVYQILDAVVDARLSRVDQPFPVTISPTLPDPGLLVSWKF
jgi:hypothetical protein